MTTPGQSPEGSTPSDPWRDQLATVTDGELAARVRAGEREAFGELWRRHSQAAYNVATQYRQIADPDDILQEVSRRIFDLLLRGGGPSGEFRPYINQSVRNMAVALSRKRTADPVGDAFDMAASEMGVTAPDDSDSTLERMITVRAFKRLNPRWQSILWYTCIEGMAADEAAEYLGLSPNATAALLIRAREGLRQEWLKAHTSNRALPAECRWVVDKLPALERKVITARQRVRVEGHLETCPRCSIVASEMNDLASRLPILLLPLLVAGFDVLNTNVETLLAYHGGSAPATPIESADAGLASAQNAQPGPSPSQVPGSAMAPGGTGEGPGKGPNAGRSANARLWGITGTALGMAAVVVGAFALWPDGKGYDGAAILSTTGTSPRDIVDSTLPTLKPTSTATPSASASASSAGSATSSPSTTKHPTPSRGHAGQGRPSSGGNEARGSDDETERPTGDGATTQAPAPTTKPERPVTAEPSSAPTPVPSPTRPGAPADNMVLDPMRVPVATVLPNTNQNWLDDFVFAGTGHAGWTVTFYDGAGTALGSTRVGANGKWSANPRANIVGNVTTSVTMRQSDGLRESDLVALGDYYFVAPSILSTNSTDAGFSGGVHVSDLAVSVNGIAGMRVELVIGARSVKDTLAVSGSRSLNMYGLPDGKHTVLIHYLDTGTGKVGASVSCPVTLP